MAKKGGGTPDAPDPKATAQAQGAANKETAIAQAILNNTSQVTPYGTSTYQQTGTLQGTPQFQQTIQLNPEQQKILDLQNALSQSTYGLGNQQIGNIANTISQPLSFGGTQALPGTGDFGAERQRVEDALYGRATSRLDPQFAQERTRMETDLVNRGFTPGTEAYNKALDSYNRAKTDAYDAARQSAVAAGGAEQSRLYNQALSGRQQGIQEILAQRNQPINELAALLGTSPGVQSPNFAQPAQTGIAPTDIIGPTYNSYQGQLAAAQNAQNAQSSLFGSLGGLGGALGGALILSDKRAKTDISKVGKLDSGEGVYTYRYKGSPFMQMGVMAQEIEKKHPEAVADFGGVKMVDYGAM